MTELISKMIGSGKPLVLLHAFPLSHKLWQGITPPKGFQLILPDFPGFGGSPVTAPGFTLLEAAGALNDHLKQLEISGPVVLGGISMGGYWAMEFLRQYPQRVEKAIFISTRPGIDKPEGRQNRLNMADKVEKEGTEFMVSAMVPGLLGKTTLAEKQEVVSRVQKWIREADPKGVALAQRAMAERRDQTDLMSTIQAPALIVAGREDALIPPTEAESMARAIPDNRLELIDRVGHLIPIEDPAGFQKILNEFLSHPN